MTDFSAFLDAEFAVAQASAVAYNAADLDAFGFHIPDVDLLVAEGHGGTTLTPLTEAGTEWLGLHVAEFITGNGSALIPPAFTASVRQGLNEDRLRTSAR